MSSERVKWAGTGADLSALGLGSSAPLFAPTLQTLERLEILEDSPARLRARFVLPGTADVRGNLSGRPGALGTGWLWLTVHRPHGWRAPLAARFRAPRSASLAEREWNLLCHLRAHGVGTPEPVLVGARGSGLVARHSFLLVRALADAFPLPRYLRTDGSGPERERVLRALGLTLALVARAGVELAGVSAEHLWVTPSAPGGCTEEALGPRRNRLPGVALAWPGEARLTPQPAEILKARNVQRLQPSLEGVLTPEEIRELGG